MTWLIEDRIRKKGSPVPSAGTTGRFGLLTEDSINQIFQIRSNTAREVMNIARNHLHREHVKEKQKSTKILEDLEGELEADLAARSRQLVSMHTKRHLSSFTDELSTRREWLVELQPSITDTISMKPDGRCRDARGNLPPELMSDDDSRNLKPTHCRRNLRGKDRRNGNVRGISNQSLTKP